MILEKTLKNIYPTQYILLKKKETNYFFSGTVIFYFKANWPRVKMDKAKQN